ncbi:hypothetical protein BO78DRAFT_99022 [Aspergillus sclerotiicarbonarius CBS 121057]|uniref:Uncharacterized protein n=1 Tax=Aspergillus sclerotiicarbonarius (strain CBS 121057 / IBT 28362) TaxID=1448318 RepID=A0A319EU48_ASPSB|nr:hypothetical protein BO78DRAFT_99022 [Aspergillus sclerotiicarbonarius CBS 121057]
MNFREKVRKVFRRSSSGSSSKSKGNGIKIEYYKRHEIPRSKFKGPFDREHQRKLAAWSFGEAQAERPRTPDLCLSPCASIPDYLRSHYEEDDDLAPDQIPTAAPEVDVTVASPSVHHDEYACGRQGDSGSSSSTAVEAESYSESMMTLYADVDRVNSIAQLKETVRYTSPVVRAISPPPLSPKGCYMPFSPEDLTRALNAVQICS